MTELLLIRDVLVRRVEELEELARDRAEAPGRKRAALRPRHARPQLRLVIDNTAK